MPIEILVVSHQGVLGWDCFLIGLVPDHTCSLPSNFSSFELSVAFFFFFFYLMSVFHERYIFIQIYVHFKIILAYTFRDWPISKLANTGGPRD